MKVKLSNYILMAVLQAKPAVCKEIIDEVKMGIKEIKQRYFSIEGMFYLVLTLFFFWVRVNFLMINY